jgi:hypothetical protein
LLQEAWPEFGNPRWSRKVFKDLRIAMKPSPLPGPGRQEAPETPGRADSAGPQAATAEALYRTEPADGTGLQPGSSREQAPFLQADAADPRGPIGWSGDLDLDRLPEEARVIFVASRPAPAGAAQGSPPPKGRTEIIDAWVQKNKVSPDHEPSAFRQLGLDAAANLANDLRERNALGKLKLTPDELRDAVRRLGTVLDGMNQEAFFDSMGSRLAELSAAAYAQGAANYGDSLALAAALVPERGNPPGPDVLRAFVTSLGRNAGHFAAFLAGKPEAAAVLEAVLTAVIQQPPAPESREFVKQVLAKASDAVWRKLSQNNQRASLEAWLASSPR